ncbi:carboxy-S-adenosyl-L-methionine synthase CmoA [Thiorhodovibrio frisius]|uniref:Carboxy-S-adenosyl-L-methionine synthase n=1 Tax=Thiorhodovibrio frisius TaxID=631362 RepID=H8YY94_9GAMM|nr:carboxy-S-adenosyl-L-methionine synthase CmoA [Thiorhodovibrio frisius]EIC23420.1 methyltransferase, putative [Thiorhodovibrio frisius]WPL23498.1 tRNA (cmo5U34)-methyltransferase [Thiorhodovibrio frisius]
MTEDFQQNTRDRLYAGMEAAPGDFAFDDSVARVFPDMISRSVPCYCDLVKLMAVLARRFLHPDARCFDLGCSLGAVSAALLGQYRHLGLRVVAVDNSQAMIDRLNQRLAEEVAGGRLQARCEDLTEVDTSGASLLILNLTLQFIAPEQRLALLARLRERLQPGGGLLLAEKVQCANPDAEHLLAEAHAEFKRANGYSELEISRKRAALERVMRLDAPEVHAERLRAAGFTQVVPWFQCLNFMAWAAWA